MLGLKMGAVRRQEKWCPGLKKMLSNSLLRAYALWVERNEVAIRNRVIRQ